MCVARVACLAKDMYLFLTRFVRRDCSKAEVLLYLHLPHPLHSPSLLSPAVLSPRPLGTKNTVTSRGIKLVPATQSQVISIIIRRSSLCRIRTLKVTVSDPPRETGARLRVSAVAPALYICI